MTRASQVRAPGKMMWLGEYVVLHGAPALVAAIDRHAVASWKPGGTRIELRTQWNSESTGAPPWVLWEEGMWVEPTDQARLVRCILDELLAADLWEPEAGVLRVDTAGMSAGHKLGLGSSGAVAAGVTTLLSKAADPDTIEACALAGHDRFQGRVGSGSDVRCSLHGGVVIVERGCPTMNARVPDGLAFAAIDTGVSADTRHMVRQLEAWRSDVGDSKGFLDEMTRVARLGAAALQAGDVASFIQAAGLYGGLERRLTEASGVPIVNEPVDRAMRAAESAGWVAKPSGAGGGDVVVAFGNLDASRESLSEAACAVGLRVVDLGVSDRGSLGWRVSR